MKIYFAHPISEYGSDREKKIITKLEGLGFEVVNPSAPEHQNKVEELQSQFNERSVASKKIMEYFTALSIESDACFFQSFPDGSLGAGVVKEINSLLEENRKVYQVSLDDGKLSINEVSDLNDHICLDVDNTRAMLRKLMPSYK